MSEHSRKILLIGTSEQENKFFINLLEKQAFKVLFASNIEMAIQKAIADLPDLVLCFYELKVLNGFQVFNILEGEILNNEIPFVLIFNQFRKNELLVAIELGIDSFIFPPFDEEHITNILNNQLTKNGKKETSEELNFDSFCNVIPYGIFIAENKRIIETNATFEKLVNKTLKHNGIFNLSEVFSFNTGNNDELKLSRFLNGLTSKCNFSDIGIRGRKDDRFNLYFSLVKSRGSSSKIIGVIIPITNTEYVPENFMSFSITDKKKKDNFINADLITSREKQILELSASGLPIKQIAQHLGISERTVEKHRSNIIQKTKSENIMEAVFLYGKNHMLGV